MLSGPTTAQVLHQLGEYAIAHFACHGTTNLDDPSRSGLVLADQTLTVAALSAVTGRPARLPVRVPYRHHRRRGLADEAIHITSAFQLAGFPHVIGTLWPIGDYQGTVLATEFHAALRATARLLRHRAYRPSAPRHHQTDPREVSRRAALWASHIHVGA